MKYEEYLKIAPDKNKIHYWDLPKNVSVGFELTPQRLNLKNDRINVNKLLEKVGRDKAIEKEIKFVGKGRGKIKVKFPFDLHNVNYVRLYALMQSEGSTNTEFSLHVPEREFHELFRNSLIKIFGRQINKFIKQKKCRNILRSRAPSVIRFLLPIPTTIPKIILQNKKFSREYLRITFEAEGSPIYVGNKRYISLKRNSDISKFLNGNLKYPIEKRIYFRQLSKDYPIFAQKIKENPDDITIGEKILLEKYFGVKTTILPECIRINKTNFRCGGKVSVRWNTYIYAKNVNRFIENIDFLSKSKKEKSKRMSEYPGRNEQFFAFELMKKISQNKIFTTKDFNEEMRKFGYKSRPVAYIWRYKNSGKINRIGRGKYRILDVN